MPREERRVGHAEGAQRVVHAAIDRGINLIDTADSYGNKGGSEEELGRILGAKRKEIVLAILHAGEVFGEIAMLDGKPRSADATALTACNLAVLDRRDVLTALEHNPGAWLGLVGVLCSRLRAAAVDTDVRGWEKSSDHAPVWIELG